MIIKKNLNVTVEEFYGFIQEMVLQDIREATGRTVDISEVQPGYKYKKKLTNRVGQVGNVKTEIVNLSSNNYRAEFKSEQGINVLSYTYEALDDSNIELTYEEDFIGKSSAMKWNYKLMSLLYNHSNKKRIRLLLNQIEKLITDRRESA